MKTKNYVTTCTRYTALVYVGMYDCYENIRIKNIQKENDCKV